MTWCYQRNRHCPGRESSHCCGHAAWTNTQQVFRVTCGNCGQEYSGQHFCPALHNSTSGARESKPLTEEDVRRIVREELAAEKEENRRKLRAFIAEVHGAGDDQTPGQSPA